MGPSDIHASAPASVTVTQLEDGLWLMRWEAQAGGDFSLTWTVPAAGIQSNWHPDRQYFRGVPMPWARDPILESSALSHAPVQCLLDCDGRNRLTFAVDEVVAPVRLVAEIHEDDIRIHCAVHMRLTPARRAVTLRLDTRPLAWHQAVAEVGRWWVPPEQRLAHSGGAAAPLWCSWYVYHQRIRDQDIVAQARAAAALGFETVAIDDAWQTGPQQRNMGGTGDWLPVGVADLDALVAQIHALGLRTALWFAPPFIGDDAACRAQFAPHRLAENPGQRCIILDPRRADLSEVILTRIVERVRQTGVGGVFLDFLGCWGQTIDTDGSVVQAGDQFCAALSRRLRAVATDLHIQYRMPFHGPRAWTRADILRANDCPGDCLTNRVRVLDMRALCGERRVHGDMALWHPHADAVEVARHCYAQCFCVPQVSVDLVSLPAGQRETLRAFLAWWKACRRCLLEGELDLRHPEQDYTQVSASLGRQRVTVCYTDTRCPADHDRLARWDIVNATGEASVVLELMRPARVRTFTCEGAGAGDVSLSRGLHAVAVAPCGRLLLTRDAAD